MIFSYLVLQDKTVPDNTHNGCDKTGFSKFPPKNISSVFRRQRYQILKRFYL